MHETGAAGVVQPGDAANAADPLILRGACRALFAFDIGFAIDLDAAQRSITAEAHRARFTHRRRAPYYFEYQPPPLRIIQNMADPVDVGPLRTAATVESVLYDFGAVLIVFSIPLSGRFSDLLALSDHLYDHPRLLEQARAQLQALLGPVSPAVRRLSVSELVEDYCIYEIAELSPALSAEGFVDAHRELIAGILRAEPDALSPQQIDDALSCRISFSPDDCAIIDWNAAMLLDSEGDDVRSVLEFANVELLELRFLDDRLDAALDQGYESMQRRASRRLFAGRENADLWRIAQLQADSALLFEGVNNTLKLLGDQYLARVYRLASQRFHLADWDASILRKIQTVESIYSKIVDRQATWRLEVLEWIIIILIALSIVISFVPGLSGK